MVTICSTYPLGLSAQLTFRAATSPEWWIAPKVVSRGTIAVVSCDNKSVKIASLFRHGKELVKRVEIERAKNTTKQGII